MLLTDSKISREILLQAFLEQEGCGHAIRQKIAGDASFRSYERIRKKSETTILMDAPPPMEDVRPFIKISEFLTDNGFSAPDILAKDVENGFLLLEDLGDDVFTRVLSGKSGLMSVPGQEEFYKLAIDALTELHKLSPPDGLPVYDENLMLKESDLLTEWYLPLMNGYHASNHMQDEYEELWHFALSEIDSEKEVLVLRDYHADNLMWLPERAGFSKVGLLDFQDAVTGHPAYDLVSLLEDARRDVEPDFAKEMLEYYFSMNKNINKEKFMTSYAILGAQRNCKILGIFSRLAIRDAKRDYLRHMPRVWKYLENDLKHPALKDLKKWLDNLFSAKSRSSVPEPKKAS